MPNQIPDKSNTAGSTLDAITEFNPLKNDLYTQITSSDQVLTNGVNDQFGKSTSNLIHWANFSTDSGSANAYVLTVQSPALAPTKLKTGMLVRFRAANNNTGASTINAYAHGVKKVFKQDGVTELDSDEIITLSDTEVRYDESLDASAGAFLLTAEIKSYGAYTISGSQTLVTNVFSKLAINTGIKQNKYITFDTGNNRLIPKIAGCWEVKMQSYTNNLAASSDLSQKLTKNGIDIAVNNITEQGAQLSNSIIFPVTVNGTTDFIEGFNRLITVTVPAEIVVISTFISIEYKG